MLEPVVAAVITAFFGALGTFVSVASFVGRRIDRLEEKFDRRIDALDEKFDRKFDALMFELFHSRPNGPPSGPSGIVQPT